MESLAGSSMPLTEHGGDCRHRTSDYGASNRHVTKLRQIPENFKPPESPEACYYLVLLFGIPIRIVTRYTVNAAMTTDINERNQHMR